MNYQQENDFRGRLKDGVNRITDDGSTSWIEPDPNSADWKEYQAWVMAGNSPTTPAAHTAVEKEVQRNVLAADQSEPSKAEEPEALTDVPPHEHATDASAVLDGLASREKAN